MLIHVFRIICVYQKFKAFHVYRCYLPALKDSVFEFGPLELKLGWVCVDGVEHWLP